MIVRIVCNLGTIINRGFRLRSGQGISSPEVSRLGHNFARGNTHTEQQ